MDHSRNKKAKVMLDTDLSLIHSSLIIEEELETLPHELFDRMLPHVWFKAVPTSKDDVSNIALAMGQS